MYLVIYKREKSSNINTNDSLGAMQDTFKKAFAHKLQLSAATVSSMSFKNILITAYKLLSKSFFIFIHVKFICCK